jgi:hypothetical protein
MTLNQIIAAIRRAGENHKMLRSVAFGPEYDLVADGGKDNYPLMWVIPDTITMLSDMSDAEKEKKYTFAVAVMDRQFEDSTNQLEVLSDTQQILEDIISSLQYIYRNSRVNFGVNDDALPFYDAHGDNVAGYTIRLEVNVPYNRDFCSVPSNDYAFPNIDQDIQIIDGGYYNSTYSLTIDGGIE